MAVAVVDETLHKTHYNYNNYFEIVLVKIFICIVVCVDLL